MQRQYDFKERTLRINNPVDKELKDSADLSFPNILTDVTSTNSLTINTRRFQEFFDLMDTLYSHSLTRSSVSMIGRSVASAGWSLVEDELYAERADKKSFEKLYAFYNAIDTRAWDNIQDFYGTSTYKFPIAAEYLRYFGQAAFYIVRDPITDEPSSIDFLHGLVVPNIDSQGRFKNPAFIQYIDRTGRNKVEFNSPRDIIYIVNPDFSGSPIGGTDMSALSEFSLPIDIYLQLSAREYLKNRNTPEVIWELPSDLSDEAFDAFCDRLEDNYGGPMNIGKNPIAIRGELNFHELRGMPDQLPYQESRVDTRREILAATGLTTYKLGIADNVSENAVKEYRREYNEATIKPICNAIEEAFYIQIHLREFGIRDWRLSFNSPSFLNAVEQATVDMRYIQNGVFSPNETRRNLGKPPRPDGDVYVDITGGEGDELEQNTQGSPPEGREQRPDAPAETGEPSEESGQNDPERGDRSLMLAEIKRWKKFTMNRIKNGKNYRKFSSDFLSADVVDGLNEHIESNYSNEDAIISFFESLTNIIQEYEN